MAFLLKQLFPGLSGTRAALHDLEAAIMDVIWDLRSEAISVREVVEGLQPTRDLAYTTVMTTMDRLAKRELLLRRMDGRAWVYRPALDRAGFLALVARQTLDGLPEGARDSALAWFVDELADADEDQLAGLADLIERKRAARGKS